MSIFRTTHRIGGSKTMAVADDRTLPRYTEQRLLAPEGFVGVADGLIEEESY